MNVRKGRTRLTAESAYSSITRDTNIPSTTPNMPMNTYVIMVGSENFSSMGMLMFFSRPGSTAFSCSMV